MTDVDALPPAEAQAIRDRLEEIAAKVRTAASEAHGSPEAVRILLATKTQPAARIRAALEAGFTLIGENRVQELVAKAPDLADVPHEAHLIGPLQKNKVNHTLRAGAACVQSIDDLAVAQKLSARIETLLHEGAAALAAEAPGTVRGTLPAAGARQGASGAGEQDGTDAQSGTDEPAAGTEGGSGGSGMAPAGAVAPVLEVMLQVNTSGEESKSGVAPADAEALAEQVRVLSHLRIGGLMTIGFPGATEAEIRPSYADLRELSQRLRETGALPADATALSMGMSGDYVLAIAEGATMVRVGSSVFGARGQ
ncbi:YggS family pyridoxal phosphate enzyme [Brevibacterium album]|uniref:YggS family pyridoxal phosphate enzyme n=1 Tax=Brevibacterium album TaxID=417948 RepID=UPI00048B8DE0|nr:YggS family pyridoxal phosphate enzyme [Brevibacterium album]